MIIEKLQGTGGLTEEKDKQRSVLVVELGESCFLYNCLPFPFILEQPECSVHCLVEFMGDIDCEQVSENLGRTHFHSVDALSKPFQPFLVSCSICHFFFLGFAWEGPNT